MGTLPKEVIKSFNRQNELCCTNLLTIVGHEFKQDELFEIEMNGSMVEGHLTDRCINQVYDTTHLRSFIVSSYLMFVTIPVKTEIYLADD